MLKIFACLRAYLLAYRSTDTQSIVNLFVRRQSVFCLPTRRSQTRKGRYARTSSDVRKLASEVRWCGLHPF